MINEQTAEHIILQLKQIDIDGETMEHIIEQVGMSDQMLRQLVMKADPEHLRDLIVEKVTIYALPEVG
jgi:hypothetical protein